MKRTPPIRPAEAWHLIQENVKTHARVYSLSSDEYALLIEELARTEIMGAAVYDAVIARVAELTGVDLLVTLNVADFGASGPAVRRGSCRPRPIRRREPISGRAGRAGAKRTGQIRQIRVGSVIKDSRLFFDPG